MGRFYVSILSLVLMAGLASGCRDRHQTGDTVESVPDESMSTPGAVTPPPEDTPTPTPTASPLPSPVDGTQGAFPIEPPRGAVLTARRADAQINLRSGPTTQSPDKGYGLVGDRVTLLRSITGEGDFTWYYVKFANSGTEGWIRSDFIDTSTALRSAEAGGEGFEAEGACSGDLKTRYDSPSYMIFICELQAGGLRYIAHNRETGESVVTDNVTTDGGGYVAKENGYEYHLNGDEIVVYRVDNGQYSQLVQEDIQSTFSF
ncbi:hypothetical protein C7271_12135 [filamentous cyanobacterium CCP5]|nr:hypothetical protein C7271_12135 [filamentous cyanobacterium CCP5]